MVASLVVAFRDAYSGRELAPTLPQRIASAPRPTDLECVNTSPKGEGVISGCFPKTGPPPVLCHAGELTWTARKECFHHGEAIIWLAPVNQGGPVSANSRDVISNLVPLPSQDHLIFFFFF